MREDAEQRAVGTLGAAWLVLAALLFPFLQLRPNRVLTGQAYRLWQVPGSRGPWLMALLLAVLLLGQILPRRRALPRAGCLLLLFLLLLGSLAWSSAALAPGQDAARVSIGSGFWLSLAGFFLLLYDVRTSHYVSKRLRSALGLLILLTLTGLLMSGAFSHLSVMREYLNRRDTFLMQVSRHLLLSLSAVLAAAALGLPLSFLLFTRRRLERAAFFLINMGQTIPTLSLLGLLMVPLSYLSASSPWLKSLGVSGVGFWPAWIALFLYALFPILHNALAGLKMVDPAFTQAALGVGMTPRQVFLKVQVPLAVPLMLGGLRTALTQTMGNAVLAALIGGGGLGSFIFLGLAQSAPDLILLGTVPLVMMTFFADALLARLGLLMMKGGRTA
ncbi:MAG: ABC transporter permease [Christensenellales bacterium]